VSLCPVITPAGGLVRVVQLKTDATTKTLLDDSYTHGTAPCTLEAKMRWKLGDVETRGPPPFKVARPEGLWDERVNKLLTSVGDSASSFKGFDEVVAPFDAALKKRKDSGIIKGNPLPADLIALLEPAEQAAMLPVANWTLVSLAKATGNSDAIAVADWKRKIEKELKGDDDCCNTDGS